MIEDAGALPAPQARSDTKATLHTVYHTSRSAGYAEVSLLYLDMQTYMLTPTTCACSAIYSRQFCTRVCSLRPRGTKIPVPARILTCAHAGVPNSGQRMKRGLGTAAPVSPPSSSLAGPQGSSCCCQSSPCHCARACPPIPSPASAEHPLCISTGLSSRSGKLKREETSKPMVSDDTQQGGDQEGFLEEATAK